MTNSTSTLSGKVALVTGGSRGIGAAIARRLAADGAAVAITYTSSPEKAETVVKAIVDAGGRAVAIRAEATDAEAVKAAVDQTVQTLGRLDILVNNAGIVAIYPIGEFPLEEFDRLVAINIRGAFVATQAASKYLGEGGRVIMIGSCTADRIPMAGGGPYAMTKGAIAALTRGLAHDFGPRGITVNNVQPGPIDTDMNPADGPLSDSLKKMMPVGRFGTAEEVAAMVAYLASPAAGIVTGTSFGIDGGINA